VVKTELQKHVERLIKEHKSVRKAGKALEIDPAYLWRMKAGIVVSPTDETLKKLGLRRTETLRPL
jgi:hypothetical protein